MANNITVYEDRIVVELVRNKTLYKKSFKPDQMDLAIKFRDSKIKRSGGPLSNLEKATIIEHVVNCLPFAEISRLTGRSIQTISKLMELYFNTPSLKSIEVRQSRLNTMTDEECEKEFKNYLDFKS